MATHSYPEPSQPLTSTQFYSRLYSTELSAISYQSAKCSDGRTDKELDLNNSNICCYGNWLFWTRWLIVIMIVIVAELWCFCYDFYEWHCKDVEIVNRIITESWRISIDTHPHILIHTHTHTHTSSHTGILVMTWTWIKGVNSFKSSSISHWQSFQWRHSHLILDWH